MLRVKTLVAEGSLHSIFQGLLSLALLDDLCASALNLAALLFAQRRTDPNTSREVEPWNCITIQSTSTRTFLGAARDVRHSLSSLQLTCPTTRESHSLEESELSAPVLTECLELLSPDGLVFAQIECPID